MIDPAALHAYVRNVHDRTYEAVELIPDDLVDWRPRPGEFSMGELVAHIAGARHMNTRTIAGETTRYEGHELPPRAGANFIRRLAEHSSTTSLTMLASADFERLLSPLPGRDPVPAWRLVISGLIEHEVHHRSQLCEYLGMNGIAPPPLYGLHVEDLPR
jgi:uncharacterized damage-inducible protein DinB